MSSTLDQQYRDSLATKHENIQKNLQELQVIETYLFDELNKIDPSQASSRTRETSIRNYIENLKNVRSGLLSNLRNLYTSANEELAYNTRHLSNQNTMSEQLSNEITLAEDELKRLKAEKNNKVRLAQVGEYEFEKNREHRGILKTIVYSSFFILLFTFMNKMSLLPKTLTQIIVVIIVSITLILLIQRFYWNFRRNNLDYSKFNQPKAGKIVSTESGSDKRINLRDALFGKCETNIQQMAQDAANRRQLEEFRNISELFPTHTSFLPSKCKVKDNSKKILYTLL